MSRRCSVTGKGVLTGNNVSHAHNKTRRRFLPNIQTVSLLSEALGKKVKMKICSRTLRSIEHNGGLDSYLTKMSSRKLTDEAVSIKRKIMKVLSAKA